jgi:protein gp37
MSDNSAIEWTTHTFNPWWGCARVSPGCRFCYADDLAKRYGHQLWRRKGERRMLSDANWKKPLKWNRDAERTGVRARVFCASMADVFEDHPQLPEPRARLWPLIEATPWLDWQLLTKRPENAAEMVTWGSSGWPTNVWLGTSVEDQRRANERIPILTGLPAAVRFLSCEPLLSSVDLSQYLPREFERQQGGYWSYGPDCDVWGNGKTWTRGPAIGWVIVGGESGSKARPMDAEWARSLRDQCVAARVPFLFKQWGGRTAKANGRELDGREWSEYPSLSVHPEEKP